MKRPSVPHLRPVTPSSSPRSGRAYETEATLPMDIERAAKIDEMHHCMAEWQREFAALRLTIVPGAAAQMVQKLDEAATGITTMRQAVDGMRADMTSLRQNAAARFDLMHKLIDTTRADLSRLMDTTRADIHLSYEEVRLLREEVGKMYRLLVSVETARVQRDERRKQKKQRKKGEKVGHERERGQRRSA